MSNGEVDSSDAVARVVVLADILADLDESLFGDTFLRLTWTLAPRLRPAVDDAHWGSV